MRSFHLSSTDILARVSVLVIKMLAWPLDSRRARKFVGRLRQALSQVAEISLGGVVLRLVILDKCGVYWEQVGPSCEPETLRWIEGFAADEVLFDVGANVGFFSLYAGLRGCRCVAIEPNPFSFHALARNILANGLDRQVVPLCLALAKAPGIGRLGIAGEQSGMVNSTLAGPDDLRRALGTATLTLDDLMRLPGLDFPNHLKIDVDGLEEAVLSGAGQVLADPRLRSLLIEVGDRDCGQRAAIRADRARHGLELSRDDGSDGNWIFRRLPA